MSIKAGFLLIALLAGSYAFPAKDDMSIFFDHADSSARIVGGRFVSAPYIVALTTGLYLRTAFCGGSLVTTRHVLTAANCIESVSSQNHLISSLRGVVGSNSYQFFGDRYSFSGRIVHQDYNRRTLKNNIGLLITSSNVELGTEVSLAALSFDFVGAGVATTVAGWGSISQGSTASNVLVGLNQTVVDGDVCVSRVARRAQELWILNAPHVDPALEICTFSSRGQGICNGDAGGPLMLADRRLQIGIVSWGLQCARDAPDVSVRLSAYRSWIEENTQNTRDHA